MSLIDFFSNKNNADKLISVLKFIGDYLPAIATVTALLLATVGSTLLAMSLKFIPALIGSTAAMLLNPKVLAATAVVGGASFLLDQANSGDLKRVTEKDTPVTSFAKQGGVPGFINRRVLGNNNNKIKTNNEMNIGFNGGGSTDNIPAMLTAGEFVMSKGAVDKFGKDTFMAINAAGGGTNVPIFNFGGQSIPLRGGNISNSIQQNIKVAEITPPMRPSADTSMIGMNNTFNMPNNADAIVNTAVLPTFYMESPSSSKLDVLGIKYKENA